MVREDFIGLSTDAKCTDVANGSTFYCADNSKAYVFLNGTWYEKTAEEPTPPTPVEDYGTITYLDGDNQEQTVTIQSLEELDSLSEHTESVYDVVIDNVTITSSSIKKVNLGSSVKYVGSNFLTKCGNLVEITAPELEFVGANFLMGQYGVTQYTPNLIKIEFPKLTMVEAAFLAQCNINTDVILPSLEFVGDTFLSSVTFESGVTHKVELPNIVSVGTYFMSQAHNTFNLIYGDKLKKIKDRFLSQCTSFNSDITLPASLEFVGNYFMHRVDNFTSKVYCECPTSVFSQISNKQYMLSTTSNTVPFYATGFKFAGTYKSAWRTALPNISSTTYRKSSLASD